jgi:hypothetical protein
MVTLRRDRASSLMSAADQGLEARAPVLMARA